MGDRDWRPFIYGGLASIVAEFGTFPIDTTKTRLQIQGQKIDPRHVELRYSGMVDCFVKTSRQEGVKALYCGIWPAVLRQATYGTIKFGTYYSMKRILAARRADGGAREHLPTNTVGEEKGSLVRCFVDIYRNEGVRGLWRGVGPTSQRAAVIAAVELPVYDASKRALLPALGDRPLNHLLSSLLASLGSAVASTPLDVIRTVRSEGGSALYKGFVPTWLRMGPWNIIFFITYEQLKQLY
ncbi:unnamed protein product [Leptidea sinapis]|uniref:Uncharacterized protein n=1 Tax=Leptidea sinapis TaxID=189913 RepID=A0A5E4PVA1_9NEOP|nr:unnamed protein product [Leptidea sinapis]